jgi:hypothetical protein
MVKTTASGHPTLNHQIATANSSGMGALQLYAGNLFGGIERLLLQLAEPRVCQRSASREQVRIERQFALCFKARLWEELEQRGATVHHLGEVRFSRPWTVRSARARLRHLFRSVIRPQSSASANSATWACKAEFISKRNPLSRVSGRGGGVNLEATTRPASCASRPSLISPRIFIS